MADENDIIIDSDSDLDDSVVAEETQAETIQKLRAKLKASEDKTKEYLDGWQRAQADFVNIRKRDEEAKAEFLKFAIAGFIEELMPVLDSFELALQHGNKDIEPVYNQFMQILKSKGFEVIDPKGANFDPKYHDAISNVPVSTSDDDHKVMEVLKKGYSLNGRVIRPAAVKVGEHVKE